MKVFLFCAFVLGILGLVVLVSVQVASVIHDECVDDCLTAKAYPTSALCEFHCEHRGAL